MEIIKNDCNNFKKRTVASIKKIINQTGTFKSCMVENMGDNRSFSITGRVDLKARYEIKKQFGFLIEEVASNTIYFKAY